jgi:NAD(P)-dependent dehydrogenase (short-subunit alcohol dehydrogenase family)
MTNPFDLTRRRVLVTGASSGIGRAAAILLSQLGANLVLTARRTEALEQTRAALAGDGHVVEPFDMSAVDHLPEWMKTLTAAHGVLSGAVHAAGIRKTMPLRAQSLEALQQTFRVNVESAMMLAKGFRQKGCCTRPSSLVFITSVAAFAGGPAMAAYAASKAALGGMTRSLAIELAGEGIRVNCVAPGMVESDMSDEIRRVVGDASFAAIVAQHPLGLGDPRDVAGAVAYLLSDAARWTTGQTLVVDGGFSAQ